VKSSEVRDKILEAEAISLKDHFAEQLKKQDIKWQRVLRHQEDRAAEILNQQTASGAEQHQKDRQAAKELLDRQNQKFQNAIQALTDRIDHHEKPSFTIPPIEAGDGDAGHSKQGQFDPWIPPDNPKPDKRSASTSRQKKERELTVEETFNRGHHRQVILEVILTHIQVTMTTMTIK